METRGSYQEGTFIFYEDDGRQPHDIHVFNHDPATVQMQKFRGENHPEGADAGWRGHPALVAIFHYHPKTRPARPCLHFQR